MPLRCCLYGNYHFYSFEAFASNSLRLFFHKLISKVVSCRNDKSQLFFDFVRKNTLIELASYPFRESSRGTSQNLHFCGFRRYGQISMVSAAILRNLQ